MSALTVPRSGPRAHAPGTWRDRTHLGLWAKGADGGDSDEGEAFVEVLVGGASLQEGERDEVELSFQHQDQLPVPAHGAAGAHQALQGKRSVREGGREDQVPPGLRAVWGGLGCLPHRPQEEVGGEGRAG